MSSSPSAPYQSLLGRLLKRKPDHSTLLAIKAASKEKPEMMRSLLDRALKSNPYDLLALFLDAICEVQHTDDDQSDFSRFRSRLQTLVRIAPDHCLTRMAQALLHIQSEDPEKAKMELDLALADHRVREEPDLASVAFLWRSYCYPEGEEQAARQDLGECLVRDPDNTEALEARGISFFEAGMWRDAIRDFDRLLNVDRKHKLSLEYRGYCRLYIGQHDASGSDFQTLAGLDAAFAVARTGLTVARVRRAFAQGIDLGDDASRFFLWPDIPEDKLQAVVDSYAAGHVNDNTTILLIYDDTFWRGGGDGFAITDSQLLWHDAGESCQVRQLSSIHNVRYKAALWGNKLYVDSQPISLTYLSEASGKLLAKLLVDIANEQRWMDEGAVLATVG